VELFERYCLPSVSGQTVDSFRWIIYFDPESPAWLKSWMKQPRCESAFVPIFRSSVSRDELLHDLREVSGAMHQRLMTTNLDNDDGLSFDFVERLGQVSLDQGRAAVYLAHGLIRSGKELYLRKDAANAFCSVLEDWNGAETCWSTWHNLLGKTMPIVEMGGDPAWLQVVHGGNVSNRVHGKRVSADDYHLQFGPLLDGVDTVDRLAALADGLIRRPGRAVRDAGRSTLKYAAYAVLGKHGLERFRSELAAHSFGSGRPPR